MQQRNKEMQNTKEKSKKLCGSSEKTPVIGVSEVPKEERGKWGRSNI